ncbi:hypothetical protein [Cytobacillus oceanisediminis]|uniref:hypothetical protein n=1 Tax=Cytobacillus oceanisediminis TaxID=665099 RepID=UPI00203FD8E5|nr:hypothetical protein [Cytobacillus oceanisediminis]MCM3393290.1 hypothetical protein [Cytobacillus oceanisediminis]
MNQTLSTFLKIAVTVVSISAFLFFIGYNMISSESTEYQTEITGISNNLPSDGK